MKVVIDILKMVLGALAAKKPIEAPVRAKHSPWDTPSLELIKSSEGLRLHAYKPHKDDVWTIGYGHTHTVHKDMHITREEAEELLLKDVAWVKNAVDRTIKVEMNPDQLAAVYSFIYNIGAGAWRTSTLLTKLNKGDYIGAGNEFKRWNKSSGKVLKGLSIRRAKEAALFRK